MRNGFLVIGLCLLISAGIGYFLSVRYKDEVLAVQDLVTGLIYFIEQNDGRFPASEAEFVASPFVSRQPDGAIVIKSRPESDYRKETYGYPIRDLARFQIHWGMDLLALRVDERGKLVDSEGKEASPVIWPSSERSGKEYAKLLYTVAKKAAEGATATRPAD